MKQNFESINEKLENNTKDIKEIKQTLQTIARQGTDKAKTEELQKFNAEEYLQEKSVDINQFSQEYTDSSLKELLNGKYTVLTAETKNTSTYDGSPASINLFIEDQNNSDKWLVELQSSFGQPDHIKAFNVSALKDKNEEPTNKNIIFLDGTAATSGAAEDLYRNPKVSSMIEVKTMLIYLSELLQSGLA
ncbi:MAG: hypothetical protein HRT47_10590 [Candidatus Caenarcaniphilales bacterium]|nr:hypothetical protein [Candidatus Caenarcaniphilales bacterium]